MKNPTEIEILNPRASYEVPKYKVTAQGLEEAGVEVIRFVRGNKSDPSAFNQQGILPSSLVEVLKIYALDNGLSEKNKAIIAACDELHTILTTK